MGMWGGFWCPRRHGIAFALEAWAGGRLKLAKTDRMGVALTSLKEERWVEVRRPHLSACGFEPGDQRFCVTRPRAACRPGRREDGMRGACRSTPSRSIEIDAAGPSP